VAPGWRGAHPGVRSLAVTSSRSLLAPELGIVVGCLAMLAAVSLPPGLGLRLGAATTVVSLALGVVAGFVYHVRLHRELAPLPARWWWSPTALHGRLAQAQRARVIPWFVAGAAGFVGSLLGCAIFLSAALRV
jgi:hypothetical protein